MPIFLWHILHQLLWPRRIDHERNISTMIHTAKQANQMMMVMTVVGGWCVKTSLKEKETRLRDPSLREPKEG